MENNSLLLDIEVGFYLEIMSKFYKSIKRLP